MAVVVDITFPGSSIDMYDTLRQEAGLVGAGREKMPGVVAHYAWEDDEGFHTFGIWESAEHFQTLFASTIKPAAVRAGLDVHPVIKISPLHYSIT